MQDAHPSPTTNMLYDLELFLSLLTSVLLITLAIPVRKLTLSPHNFFDQSCYHSQNILHGAITSSEMAHSCMASPHQANMHSLVVMAGSWKGRCVSLAVAAAVSDSVLANGHLQEETYGCLTAAKISASHPLPDKDGRLDFLVCTTWT